MSQHLTKSPIAKAIFSFLFFFVFQVLWTGLAALLSGSKSLSDVYAMLSEPTGEGATALGLGLMLSAAVTVVMLWLLKLMPRPLLRESATPGWQQMGFIAAALPLLLLGMDALGAAGQFSDSGMEAVFTKMANNWACAIGIVVVGPLVEEIVFRHCLLRHLVAARLHPIGAVVVTALVFGICHGNWLQGVTASLMGLVLGLLYLRTGDIRLSFPFHVGYNAVGTFLFHHPEIEQSIFTLPRSSLAIIALVAALAGAVCIYFGIKPSTSRTEKS